MRRYIVLLLSVITGAKKWVLVMRSECATSNEAFQHAKPQCAFFSCTRPAPHAVRMINHRHDLFLVHQQQASCERAPGRRHATSSQVTHDTSPARHSVRSPPREDAVPHTLHLATWKLAMRTTTSTTAYHREAAVLSEDEEMKSSWLRHHHKISVEQFPSRGPRSQPCSTSLRQASRGNHRQHEVTGRPGLSTDRYRKPRHGFRYRAGKQLWQLSPPRAAAPHALKWATS